MKFNDFQKKEQKIWNMDTIKNGDKFYFIDFKNSICHSNFITGHLDHLESVKYSIAFKKHKYAEEYLKELKKFVEEYKKNN